MTNYEHKKKSERLYKAQIERYKKMFNRKKEKKT